MAAKGSVAAGHPETARIAEIILSEGGNAFDAALAALCAIPVTEPVLSSLGGGGFLLARPAKSKPVLFDFFVQTPRSKRPEHEVDFGPITADFGAVTQEFHIGKGAMATPGVVKGLFAVHEELGRMPMARVVEPALALAKRGAAVNRLQAYILSIVEAIYTSSEASRIQYGSKIKEGHLLQEGEVLAMPAYADALDSLAREGEGLFYRGEIGQSLVKDCREGGGFLSAEDLARYEVKVRKPLELEYRGAKVFTNPPPSTGGILIAFALELLKSVDMEKPGFGSLGHLEPLTKAMDLTNRARIESGLHEEEEGGETLLNPEFLGLYRDQLLGRPQAPRGTTHVSVIDAAGNAASLTLSNGEGCGYIIPGTGIMMNNMLGEEDINPHGFHKWPVNLRMASMMSPSLVLRPGGREIVLGSGGSNRIRTAVLQVLLNLLDFGMEAEEAVEGPRIHYENGLLNVEPGFEEGVTDELGRTVPDLKLWTEKNLFFGGVHCVAFDPSSERFHGAGDPRRGGVALTV